MNKRHLMKLYDSDTVKVIVEIMVECKRKK
jgi:hypothetical protein